MAISTALQHTAVYSKAALVTLIRDEIKEPTAHVFSSGSISTPDDLDGWIDLGASVASVLGYTSEQEEEIALTSGLYKVGCNALFHKIYGVGYIDGPVVAPGVAEIPYGLQKVRPQAYGFGTGAQSNADQPAKYFWTHGNGTVITVYFVPTYNSTTDVIKVFGYTRLTAHDTGALPEEMQLAPLHYALAHVYARLGKHRKSALNMKKFIVTIFIFKLIY